MKIRHFIITSFIFLLCASFVNAEEAVWNDTFDYGDGRDIAVDLDGNSYVTGGKYDIVTIKYAPNGIRLWNSTYYPGINSWGNAIEVDNGGNAYVTGSMSGYAIVTVKFGIPVDENAPEVTINTLEKSYKTTSIVINVTATDLNLDSVIAEINGTENITLENISGNFVNSTYEFSEGLNTVKIYANDSFGHINSNENITFRVDLNSPEITIKLIEGEYLNNGSNVINFTVNESNLDKVTAFNGSTEIALENSTGNYLNSVALNEGIYNVTIRINDTAGNIAEKSLNFIIDTTAPAAIMNTPVNGTTYTSSSAAINVTANDSLSNVSSVIAKIGSIRNVTLFFDGTYYTGNTGTLSNGNYEITIITTDLVGNVNSNETVNITVAVPASTSSGSSGSHYSSDLSEGITSSVIKNTVSNSNIVYGSEIDGEYAGKLKENLYNSEDYEISGDTIIVGGPKYNVLANKYDSKFGISISNDNPGENKGIIQVLKVQDNTGSIIQSYTVIYIAGSDRLGTQAALEYFKTLDEMPEGPIMIEWTENGPVLA